MATCSGCGAAIDAGAKFCSGCGRDVTGEQGGVATQHVSPTHQMQNQLMEALRHATLGDYEILTQLGQGGMATVYLAHDISLDRKVAIKVMNPALVSGEGMVERFKLEARTAAGLSHPHIIPIYAVKETENLLFFVMKFIDGRPLDSIIKEAAPLPVPMVRTVIAKVGEALGYAHRRGIVHRDIKPANIMIDSEGMPIVTDFGIAKVADKQGLTMTGATIGTPTYMSPEQCNALEITGASDQYSLGVLAYEMLTGRPLYDGDSVMTIMFKHVHDEPPDPEAFGPEVPADLAAAITKMLQKNPADRWETIEAALPSVSGGQAAYDDSVRTALIEFAKHSENREILKRVSTPRSPIPVSVAGAPIDSAETVRLSSGVQTGTAAAPTAVVPAKKSKKGLWIGLAALGVIGAGAAVILGPLAGGGGEPVAATTGQAAPIGTETPPAPQGPDPAPADPVETPGDEGGATPSGTTEPVTEPAQPTTPPQGATPVPVRVQRVEIVNAPTSVQVGTTVDLRARVTDQNGAALSRRVAWSSTDLAVAQVGANGLLRALAPGTTTIRAEAEGRRAEIQITVSAVPVAAVTLSSTAETLDVGGTVALSATTTDAQGTALPGRAVTWASSNRAVASVDPSGTVRAMAAGEATITATAEGRTATARITVLDPRVAISETIQMYARALEAKDVDAVRRVFPGLPSEREAQLRDALPSMDNLRVQLTIGSIQVDGDRAMADVTGRWRFSQGPNDGLPADNRYILERRGSGWVIVEIR